jgi:hypothetical protein
MHSNTTDTCFVISPFGDPYDMYFAHLIRPAVETCGLYAVREDSLYRPTAGVADIWNGIRKSKLLVAELTGRNPNVLYALGLAHAISKPAILLSESMEDIPSDLRAVRVLLYDKTHPEWGSILRQNLTNSIKEVLLYPTSAIPATFKTAVRLDPPEESETLIRLEALEGMVQRLVAGVDGGATRSSPLERGEAAAGPSTERPSLRIGQLVHHRLLGKGEILGIEGSGKSEQIKVNFERTGLKWLTPSVAHIQVLGK